LNYLLLIVLISYKTPSIVFSLDFLELFYRFYFFCDVFDWFKVLLIY